MTILATLPSEEVRRVFRVASNGFAIPDFHSAQPDRVFGSDLTNELREYFNERQVKYISSILNLDELKVIRKETKENLKDALYIAIIDSMPSEKLEDFYLTYRHTPESFDQYHALERQWMFDEIGLLRERYHREPTSQEHYLDFKRCKNHQRFGAFWRMKYPDKTIKQRRKGC